MSRTAKKRTVLDPEVRHHSFIYTAFGLGASHTGLWAYGLGPRTKSLPGMPRRPGLGGPGPCITVPVIKILERLNPPRRDWTRSQSRKSL